VQIVNRGEHGAEHFAAAIQVVQVGAREATTDIALCVCAAFAGIAGASGINRIMAGFMLCVSDFYVAKAGEQMPVACIAGGHHAVAFIHRFGSNQNEHVHFHICVIEGVFAAMTGGVDANIQVDTDADHPPLPSQLSPSAVIFHPAGAIGETAVAQMQAILRRLILRTFVGRGPLESFEAKDMLAYKHSGLCLHQRAHLGA
jgi:Putative transposase